MRAASPTNDMVPTQFSRLQAFEAQVLNLLHRECAINPTSIPKIVNDNQTKWTIPSILSAIATSLESNHKGAEATALTDVVERITAEKNFGGLGIPLNPDFPVSEADYVDAAFIVDAMLLSLNAELSSRKYLPVFPSPSDAAGPMTLAQKIFAQHLVGTNPTAGQLRAGTVIRVGLDWVLSSELSWQTMARVYESDLGSPGIWRNDRFWLAADHVVHPDAAQTPTMRDLIACVEKARSEFRMTEYQGLNYTIMHTEFVRERAEPGMLVIGADSHTCSGGAVGCLAIGLGGVDVLMGLILGETWFKVPESIFVEFQGRPTPGISGKDVILHILKELKRNTVATERIVEFGGDGARFLSCDARFTICNMAAEFGAISGIFVPDEITGEFISRRKSRRYRRHSTYFKQDPDASYAGKYVVDLAKVEPTVALYPSPDNVVPVAEAIGMQLDGVFIGACTTTEEELILAALVLKVGLKKGLRLAPGKRHYVPGSLPIVAKLESMELLEFYIAAGFTRGPPGCSYCIGLSVDRAGEGETWLSSQNRNFQNRMGKGSFGYLSSAVVCAASSFTMSVVDPRPFLQEIDDEFFGQYQGNKLKTVSKIRYSEPTITMSAPGNQEAPVNRLVRPEAFVSPKIPSPQLPIVKSRIARLGEFIDTDALAPGPALTSCITDEDFGNHCLEYTHPEFRDKVRGGQRVIVADHAFGCGSSREAAVSALKGIGIEAVLARSFAFIFNRNMRTLGLLGFAITDDAFYESVTDGEDIEVNVSSQTVVVRDRTFKFDLSDIERELIVRKGAVEGYKLLGQDLWEQPTKPITPAHTQSYINELQIGMLENESIGDHRLEW